MSVAALLALLCSFGLPAQMSGGVLVVAALPCPVLGTLVRAAGCGSRLWHAAANMLQDPLRLPACSLQARPDLWLQGQAHLPPS